MESLLMQAHALCRHLVTELDAHQQANASIVRLPPGGCSLRQIEKAAVEAALLKCGGMHVRGAQARAAKLLRLSSSRMAGKMKKHNLRGQGGEN